VQPQERPNLTEEVTGLLCANSAQKKLSRDRSRQEQAEALKRGDANFSIVSDSLSRWRHKDKVKTQSSH
jgi:hypothetical protein